MLRNRARERWIGVITSPLCNSHPYGAAPVATRRTTTLRLSSSFEESHASASQYHQCKNPSMDAGAVRICVAHSQTAMAASA